MRIFKFGGASVKDAEGVKNLLNVLSNFRKEELLVVVSAMGKTTNALEKVAKAYWNQSAELRECIDAVRLYHSEIMDDLGFPSDHTVRGDVENSFEIGRAHV